MVVMPHAKGCHFVISHMQRMSLCDKEGNMVVTT